jgi:hypothetical protein
MFFSATLVDTKCFFQKVSFDAMLIFKTRILAELNSPDTHCGFIGAHDKPHIVMSKNTNISVRDALESFEVIESEGVCARGTCLCAVLVSLFLLSVLLPLLPLLPPSSRPTPPSPQQLSSPLSPPLPPPP